MTQRFKDNDADELIVINLATPSLAALTLDLDAFLAGAFECYLLGDVLYDLVRDPLADVITRPVYRSSFPAIHNLFTAPGTFEFYIDLFKKVFGDDVEIEFVIPSPGVLEINLTEATDEEFNLVAREIVDDVYVYSNLVTSDLNEPIMGVGPKAIKTQAEIDGLIAEVSAYGIYTTATILTPP